MRTGSPPLSDFDPRPQPFKPLNPLPVDISATIRHTIADRQRSRNEQASLEISFQTRRLRTTCEIASHARKQIGDTAAAALHRRLADLRAANAVSELVAGRPRAVGQTTQIAIDLDDRYRLLLSPNHPANPIGAAGAIDWTKVIRIRIVDIVKDPDV